MPKDQPDELRARVFISCGQSKQSDEVTVASKVAGRLQELGFDPYIAVQEQTLRGIKENIFEQLSKSEYFIFVDFKREVLSFTNPPVHRGSLFSHQELALASYLDVRLLAFQESGVKRDDGILQFLQANATEFTDRHLLHNVIADEVQRRGWDSRWRNDLVLERDPAQRGDSGFDTTQAGFFHIGVRNRHRDKTATNCYAYLERATKLGPQSEIDCPAAELTWAGYRLPNVSIPPGKARKFDAFYIRHDIPTQLHFQSFSTSPEFIPRVAGAGLYELTYSVVSDNFPVARGSFTLTLADLLAMTTLKSRAGEPEM